MYILGIETSCDDTSASIISDKKEILSNIVFSQIELCKLYGGVVPEIAARNHLEAIDKVISLAFAEAKMEFNDIDGISATAGPGLSGSLIVGLTAAKTLAAILNKPFYATNHLEGHLLTIQLTNNINPPYLALLASGGHTQIIVVHAIGKYEVLGSTLDDAAGECFDKVAKILELPEFNGKIVEKYALEGDSKKFILPETMLAIKNCNFSFAGLKTAFRQIITSMTYISKQDKKDFCASFQETVTKIISRKIKHAIKITKHLSLKNLVLVGGVAANTKIRSTLQNIAMENNMEFSSPPINYCTDNAAMIAWTGLQYLKQGITSPLNCSIRPKWPLES